jgi:predicted MFS family arabinose efflux permease
MSFRSAVLLGPAAAGLVIAHWGVTAAYAMDALAITVSLLGLARLPSARAERAVPSGARPGGWSLLLRRPVFRAALATDLAATVLAMPVALFPMVNEQRFGGDPQTLGLFLSAIAVGGITAGLASGAVTRAARPGLVMLAAAGVWGVALAGFGIAPSPWLALGCLAVAGAADTISVISRGTLVQLATPDAYRGRVSAVEDVVGMAGPYLGNFRAGLVAGGTTAGFAAVSGGLLCALGIAAVAATIPALRRPGIAAKPRSRNEVA